VCFKHPAILGCRYSELLPKDICSFLWLDSCCKDDHVDFDINRATEKGVFSIDVQILCLRIFKHIGNTSTDELGTFVLDTVVELFVCLSERSDVHVEEVDPAPWDLLVHLVSVLEGIHTTEPGTICLGNAAGIVTGSCTQNVSYSLGCLSITWTDKVTTGWTGCTDKTFEFE